MIKNRILHMLTLTAFMALGVVSKAHTESITYSRVYSAAHFEATSWIVTNINGQVLPLREHTLPPKKAPAIEFMDGNIFVHQGCHSFMVVTPDKARPSYTEINFIQTLVACDPITAQQQSIVDIFTKLYGFNPSVSDTGGQDILAVVTAPDVPAPQQYILSIRQE